MRTSDTIDTTGIAALQGQTVLVTGGARRIGKAVALGLARRGMRVCVHCNTSIESARDVVDRMIEAGTDAALIQGDLSNEGVPARVIDDCWTKMGALNAIINSASIFSTDTLMDFTFEQLCRNMNVNAFGPLSLCRQMARRGNHGCIVNFLDSRVGGVDATHVSYHLSKRILDALTRHLAVEMAPGFRVNAVAPGYILSPVTGDDGNHEARVAQIPLNRKGNVEEIVHAVVFLLENQFITGQTVFVDGGGHLKESLYG